MSIRVTKTFVRPNTETAFYRPVQAYRSYVDSTYVEPGLRLSQSATLSDDQLTRTIVSEWKDQASYDQFLADPVCQEIFRLNRRYNRNHGITTSPATIETV